MTDQIRSFLGPILGLVVVAAAAAFALQVGAQQFGAYDLSLLVDLSWRFTQGQVPGRDFLSTQPNLFLAWTKLFSGPEADWFTLIWAQIGYTLLIFGLWLMAATPADRRPKTVLMTTVVLVLPLLYTNHLWHSSQANLAAVALFASAFRYIAAPSPPWPVALALTLSAALVATAKQNVAVPFLAVTLLSFTLVVRRPAACLLILVGALGGVVCSQRYLHQSWASLAYAYTAVVGRSRPDPQMVSEVLAIRSHLPLALVVLALIILGIQAVRQRDQRSPASAWFVLGTLGAGALPILTDWDAKMNDVPLIALALLTYINIVAREFPSATAHRRQRASMLAVAALGVIAVVGGVQRERMQSVGPFFQLPLSATVQEGYFRGLRTGEVFSEVLDALHRARRDARDGAIFLGPRMEFGYRVLNIPSPRDLPLYWFPGTSYASADSSKIIETFVAGRFQTLIFRRRDWTRFPPILKERVTREYVTVPGYRQIDVYRLR